LTSNNVKKKDKKWGCSVFQGNPRLRKTELIRLFLPKKKKKKEIYRKTLSTPKRGGLLKKEDREIPGRDSVGGAKAIVGETKRGRRVQKRPT